MKTRMRVPLIAIQVAARVEAFRRRILAGSRAESWMMVTTWSPPDQDHGRSRGRWCSRGTKRRSRASPRTGRARSPPVLPSCPMMNPYMTRPVTATTSFLPIDVS